MVLPTTTLGDDDVYLSCANHFSTSLPRYFSRLLSYEIQPLILQACFAALFCPEST